MTPERQELEALFAIGEQSAAELAAQHKPVCTVIDEALSDGTTRVRLSPEFRGRLRYGTQLYAALGQPGVDECAGWQFRWTNPGNEPRVDPSDIEWRQVKTRHCDTIEEEVKLLASYTYNGKPTYEVRPVFAAPQPAQQAVEQPAQELETVRVFGVRPSGEVVDTGINTPIPPRMKARELVREMFGQFEDDDASDADLCFAVCEQLIEWLVAQGWSRTAPQPAQQAVADPYDHGPQAKTVDEALSDVSKWLNERPNRPLDLRHVAMICHALEAAPQPAQQPVQHAVDWTQAGKLIEVVNSHWVSRHMTGTSNWAAAVCKLMAEATRPSQHPDADKLLRQALEALDHIQRCIGFGTATIHYQSWTWQHSEDAIVAIRKHLGETA